MSATSASVTCLSALPVRRSPRVKLPPGACDSHFHVFGTPSHPALVEERDYTPACHSYAQYRTAADKLGLSRGVVVQPSIYGTNNDLLVATLREDPDRLRGIAVVAADADMAALSRLDHANVRGLRINLINPGPNGLKDVATLGPRICEFGWHLQLQLDLGTSGLDLATMAAAAQVPIVLDHFGMLSDKAEPSSIASLKRALDTGRVWVKLSAPYRCGSGPAPYPQVATLARELVERWSDRLLWGSDWPHPGLADAIPDDVDLLDLLKSWRVDADALERIFIRNPDEIYWRT